MARQVIFALLLFAPISSVLCGEVTVTHAPSSLRFGSAGVVRTTDLDDVLAASLGYTPIQSSPWRGLTITSPFASPSAAVVVEVRGGGASVRLEGATYGLKEDATIDEVFHRLKTIYGVRAQRHTLFKHINVDAQGSEDNTHYSLPDTRALNISKEPDSSFLRDMAALVSTAHSVADLSSKAHGGQDVFFLQVDSLEQLVSVYGTDSPQVSEAVDILRSQLVRVTDLMRQIYNDDVLVVAAIGEQTHTHTRKTRSILQYTKQADLNLNTEYSADYPAIFNIILWLSIVLALSVLATSVAMATMDPGRDSIIYRMTTMRMKKDN